MKDVMGRTNLDRMKKGLAPLGPDGKSINLHHTTLEKYKLNSRSYTGVS